MQGLVENYEGRFRYIHLLTNDAAPTNEAAARHLLKYMKHDLSRKFARLPGCIGKYLVIVWICASHQSNLVVNVAICGNKVKEPTKNNNICVACSRLFRHLMSDYSEEFARALWQYLDSGVVFVKSEDRDDSKAATLTICMCCTERACCLRSSWICTTKH